MISSVDAVAPGVGRPLILAMRTDASAAIGAGHAMRCLTLGEAWIAHGGMTTVWGGVSIPFVQSRARAAGIRICSDAPTHVDVLVVDTYDPTARQALARFPAKVRVLVDDMGEDVPDGYSVVWNPNPYSLAAMYPAFGGELLHGDTFVPLRAGLPRWEPADFVAVALGGSASSPAVGEMLDVLAELLRGEQVCALGSALRPGWSPIAEDQPWLELRRARALICSASSSLWEAAHVGVPSVVVAFADNHALVLEWAERRRMAVVNLLREAPKAAAHRVVEGLRHACAAPHIASGAENVVGRLQRLVLGA